MRGDPAFTAVGKLERLTADLRDCNDPADQGPGSSGAERDRHRRTDQLALLLDPPAARSDLAGVGLVVDPSLPARNEFEMLNGIGDVNARAIDSSLFERGIEHFARGPDERATRQIFLVARLLTNEHDRCVERTLAEHRLRGVLVALAARAFARVLQ